MKFIVQAYKRASERTYTFGPFHSYEAVERFTAKLAASGEWDTPDESVLNLPSVMGTGMEMS